MKTCMCIYHFLVLNWYVFLNYYIPRHGKDQKQYKIFQDGAQWKYLTLLNLFLQAFFFGVACLDDVLKRIKGRKNIKFITAFRDLLFTTLAFPVSMFVFLVFWTIFLYDRELVYPKVLDDIFPVWMNHAMELHPSHPEQLRSMAAAGFMETLTFVGSVFLHTFILPFSLLEVILRPHNYPSKKTGIILLAAGTLAYTTRVLWIYSETGRWVYPMLGKLSPLGLTAFFSSSYFLSVTIYLLGEKINHWKWGDMMQPWMKMK